MIFRLSRLFYTSCLSLALFAPAADSYAQKTALPRVGCKDAQIRLRAVEIKNHFTAQGLEVYRDAMLGMDSQEPYPVIIDVEQGQLYQIIFVAHPESTRQFLDIYDANRNNLHSVAHSKGKEEPSYIIFTFIPPTSGPHAVILRQKWKNKDMCGSFTLLRAKKGAGSIQLKPYESN